MTEAFRHKERPHDVTFCDEGVAVVQYDADLDELIWINRKKMKCVTRVLTQQLKYTPLQACEQLDNYNKRTNNDIDKP